MATYYCDWAVGNDANAGTSEGSGNAWKSIDKAESVVAAGDTVWVKASGTYTNDGHTCVLTMTASGSAGNFIKFIGYTTTTGDGGQCVWDAASSDATVIRDNGAAKNYRWFENIHFKNATGLNYSCWGGSKSHVLVNCTSTAGTHVAVNATWVLLGHTAISQAGWGGLGSGAMIGCLASDCSDGYSGWVSTSESAGGGSTLLAHCVAHGITNRALQQRSGDDGSGGFGRFSGVMAHNTIDGENATNYGFRTVEAEGGCVCINNVVYDNDDGFLSGAGVDATRAVCHFQNVLNSNITNYGTDYDDFDVSGNDLTGAPTFVDEAAHDYTPASDSSAYGTAMDLNGINSGRDIGAIPAPIRGVRRPTAMTGGMG